MKEAYVRKKVVTELERDGYVCWYPLPPRNAYMREKDIFGIIDVVGVRKTPKGSRHKNEVRWIQLTTDSGGNLSARRRKSLDRMVKDEFYLPVELWAYNKTKRQFRKVTLTPQDVENVHAVSSDKG